MKRLLLCTTASLLCSLGMTAQNFKLNESGYFENGGANVMVFDDIYPEGHQGGVTIATHGNRRAAVGDVRFEISQGQWQGLPKLRGRVVDRDANEIHVSLSYPDTARHQTGFNPMLYPDFAFGYTVSVRGEGEARPESYWYESSLYFNELMKQGIGAKALERVLRKIGQKKAASGTYTMVVDNMNSAQLLSPILGAIDGSAIQQRNSFLLDKLGQKVLGSNVTLLDEPHLVKASGARYFDNEGVATKRQPIFQDGILKTYFIDTYRANKMQVEPTISSPSVLVMQTGTKDLEGLIAGVEKGIWVTGFNGGNCNSTTGDFSYGIEGFLIENGKVVRPVSEMNVTGNMLTLWQNVVETGNDPRVSSSWRIPSVVFEDVAFSGLNKKGRG